MDLPSGRHQNVLATVLRQAQAAVGLETNLELFSHRAGADCGTGAALPAASADYLIVNDIEIGAIAGMPTSHDGVTVVKTWMRRGTVAQQGAMRLVVVHSRRSAVALTRDGRTWTSSSVSVPGGDRQRQWGRRCLAAGVSLWHP